MVTMWFWISSCVLLCFPNVSYSEVPPCPPDSDIYPCYCWSDEFLTTIDCDAIGNIDKVIPILNKTKGLNMSYAFWNSRLENIPSDFFDGQSSVNLHFENCKIGSFGDRPFTGLEDSLERLFIYGSVVNRRRKGLETFPLGHLTKLEDLSFQVNYIKRLGNDWFEGGPASLKQLNLEDNDIEVLGDKAFASLANVEQIWLGFNNVKKVSRSMFPNPANRLWLLEMGYIGIEELPEDIFEGMPALKSINVSGNELKSLPEATWGKIWDQLDEVYLRRNSEFQCDENLKWVYQRKLPKILDGRCTNQGNLYGKFLDEITLEDFA